MAADQEPRRTPRHVEVRGGTWDSFRGWGTESEDRTRATVPWIGLVLVALGLLFLADEFLPAIRVASSLVFLAIGVGLLGLWLVRRRTAALYAGALITALAVPSVLRDLGIVTGGGWTTLSLGVGFLFIALVRYTEHGGWGWQAWVGGILVLVGGASTTEAFARLGWPVLLVLIGLFIVLRGNVRPGGTRRW